MFDSEIEEIKTTAEEISEFSFLRKTPEIIGNDNPYNQMLYNLKRGYFNEDEMNYLNAILNLRDEMAIYYSKQKPDINCYDEILKISEEVRDYLEPFKSLYKATEKCIEVLNKLSETREGMDVMITDDWLDDWSKARNIAENIFFALYESIKPDQKET